MFLFFKTKHVEFNHTDFAVWFNLTSIVSGGKITDGSHDNADMIRTATISQKHKVKMKNEKEKHLLKQT